MGETLLYNYSLSSLAEWPSTDHTHYAVSPFPHTTTTVASPAPAAVSIPITWCRCCDCYGLSAWLQTKCSTLGGMWEASEWVDVLEGKIREEIEQNMKAVKRADRRRRWRRAWQKNSSLQLTLYSHKLLLYHTVLLRDEERVNSIVNLHDYLNVNSNSFVTFFTHSWFQFSSCFHSGLISFRRIHEFPSLRNASHNTRLFHVHLLTHSLNHHSYFNLIIVHIIFYFFYYYDYISIIWFLIFHDMHFLSSFRLLPTRITYNLPYISLSSFLLRLWIAECLKRRQWQEGGRHMDWLVSWSIYMHIVKQGRIWDGLGMGLLSPPPRLAGE